MVKEYELRTRFETTIRGPNSFKIAEALVTLADQSQDDDNKLSSMLMSLNQEEIKPKTNIEEKKDKK